MEIENLFIDSEVYDLTPIKNIPNYQFLSLEDILSILKSDYKKNKKLCEFIEMHLASIDNMRYERKLKKEGYKYIAGVDEVGRGPLCGPVVTCACILPDNYSLPGLTDSKKLSEKKREELYEILIKDCIYSIGIKDEKRIDEINIREATIEAMYEAINNLSVKPDYVLIDAMDLPKLDMEYNAMIKGDFKSASISAASIIAKVTRDRMMIELDKKYPEYGYAKHKGYPTKDHIEAVKKYGVKDFYRMTFSPINELVNKNNK
jgi:ribonuclease HII